MDRRNDAGDISLEAAVYEPKSRQHAVECAILIPAGPLTAVGFLEDTVSSVHHYIGRTASHVVVIDDSRDGRFRGLQQADSGVTVLDAPDCREGLSAVSQRGSLFAKQAAGLRWLLNHVRFDALLKMDADALVTGPAPHHAAIALWEGRPDVGVVGALMRWGNGVDKAHAMASKGRQLSAEFYGRGLQWRDVATDALRASPRALSGLLRRVRWMRTLHRIVADAEQHGYVRGATCTGGAYFVNPRALEAMQARGFLEPAFANLFAVSGLSEDSLVALVAYACGFCLSDPTPERDPLAINWQGLPMSPEELVRRGKAIVHSVRDGRYGEAAVRAFFSALRDDGVPAE